MTSDSPGTSPSEGDDTRSLGFARILREARERAGLSQRDVARIMGVSSATVATSELGGDPRRSTLERLAASLPLLDPRRILLAGECVPPVSTIATSRLLRRFGPGHARRAIAWRRFESGRPVEFRTRLEGVRASAESSLDAAVTAVARRSLGGRRVGDVLAWIRSGTARLEIEEAGVLHAFERSTASDGEDEVLHDLRGMDAGIPEPYVSVRHVPWLPVETLIVHAECGDDAPASWLAASLPAVMDGRPLESAPGARVSWDAGRRVASAAFEHPLPFLSHGLWGSAEPGAAAAAPPSARAALRQGDPCAALRVARERAGLSCRALAMRLGLSVATVHGAENGLDARRSTLVALLSALVELRAEDLVAPVDAGRAATPAEAWEQCRQAIGLEVAEEIHHVRWEEGAPAAATHRVVALRRHATSNEPLILRLDAGPAPRDAEEAHPAATVATSPAAAGGGNGQTVESLIHWRLHGRFEHVLGIPAEAARHGVSLERRLALDDQDEPTGGTGAAPLSWEQEGLAHALVSMPTRTLVLIVELPGPATSFEARAWPAAGADALDLASRLHPGALVPEIASDRRRAVLRVREPLMGVRYGLLWRR